MNFLQQVALTYIQDELSSFDTAGSRRIILQRLGQTVEGFELLIILLVLHLKRAKGSDNLLSLVN